MEKILLIKWNDTCYYPDQTGIASVIMEKAVPREVIDLGFLVGEDEEKIVIASVKKEGKRFNKITAIPRGMIKEIKELK